MPDQKMTQSAASRIQSSQATGGKDTGAGSFSARAQSAGANNASQAAAAAAGNTGAASGGQGGKSGGT
ncbi:hypothetical protein JMJ35_008372 [Cladonia borealis]|uniref:SMP domain-containing protein n=1 Tax=Cladonia borealis TaxID=184061 RepID=A0AA39QW85_9LECA|nr:hypothetical protein JMJ35_008372 [Cladonia borealis]